LFKQPSVVVNISLDDLICGFKQSSWTHWLIYDWRFFQFISLVHDLLYNSL